MEKTETENELSADEYNFAADYGEEMPEDRHPLFNEVIRQMLKHGPLDVIATVNNAFAHYSGSVAEPGTEAQELATLGAQAAIRCHTYLSKNCEKAQENRKKKEVKLWLPH